MRRAYFPPDADPLLLDPRRLRLACDYLHNPAFTRARATTTDYRGRRLIDSVTGKATVREAALELERDVRRLLQGETLSIEALRETQIPKPDGRTRTIYVPSYRVRCFLNLVADVLTATSNQLLLPHVRAYRPGLQHPVPNAVKDLAAAVAKQKARFWAKIDIRDFFHRIPHELIARALSHFGYSAAFIHVVLAVARSPIWTEAAASEFASFANEVGVPMGLSPSATIANLACYEIDEDLHKLRDHVTVIRYADDFLFLAENHDRLVHAVRQVQRWARRHGLSLKGVSPDQRPRTLVHDFHDERMPALGLEIDHHGMIHIPAAKLADKDEEIDHLVGRLHENGKIVVGRSIYSHPSGVRGGGTEMMDLVDIKAVVEGAYRDWQQCDPEGANDFLRRAWARHPELLHGGSSTIWVVSLGNPGDGEHEGLRYRPSIIAEPIHPTPTPRSLRDQGMAGDGRVENGEQIRQTITGRPDLKTDSTYSDGASASAAEESAMTNDHSESIHGNHTLWIEDERTGDRPHTDPTRSIVGRAGSDGLHGLVSREDIATNPVRDGDPNRGLSWLRWRLSSIDTSRDNRFDCIVSQVVPQLASATADTDRRAPSSPRCFANFRIHAHHVPRHHGVPGSRVVVALGGDEVEEFYPRVPVEVALVRELRTRVAVEISQGTRVIAVETDAWLPKHLLQNHRHFHSVVLFGEVLGLHDDVRRARARLLVVGRSES